MLMALAALTAPQAHGLSGGGGVMPEPAKVTDIRCETRCGGMRIAAPGSTVRIYGRNLDKTATVRFPSGGGARIGVDAETVTATWVTAIVPEGAITGKPRPRSINGTQAALASGVKNLQIVAVEVLPAEIPFAIESASTPVSIVYPFADQKASLKYAFSASVATDVRIQIVAADDRSVIREWVQRQRNAFVDNRITWDGSKENGKGAKPGKYYFRLGAMASNQAPTKVGTNVSVSDHAFPLRSAVTFGDGYGAGRGHQGVDLMSPCGKPIRAARAGEVTWRRFQSAAGNYLVIRGKGINRDYVYMHMKKPSPIKEGKKVKTGQVIGKVGTTGRSSACHLHLEVWKGRWYRGGSPMTNIKNQAKRWHRLDPLAGRLNSALDRIPALTEASPTTFAPPFEAE